LCSFARPTRYYKHMIFISTLRTGYPCVQALSQDKRQGGARVLVCPKALAPASRLVVAPGLPRVPMTLAPTSRLRAAPGPPHVPVAPAPVSQLGAALGWSCVIRAPAPAFWLRAAPKLPRIPRTGSTSCKQLNKHLLVTRPS
jgi:hypothetical protein